MGRPTAIIGTLLLAACGPSSTQADMSQCFGDASVRSVQLTCGPSSIVTDAGAATLSLCVSASIPCLLGTTHALVTTSNGSVGMSGTSSAPVLLAPAGGNAMSGDLRGVVQLLIPAGETAHVLVQVGDTAVAEDLTAMSCVGAMPNGC